MEGTDTAMNQQRFSYLLLHCVALICGFSILFWYIGPQALPVAAESFASIRIIHAAPDIGTVDVFMDGTKLLSSFQYATVTGYLPLPAGAHTVQLALIGTGIDASVITQKLSVEPGKAYTIAALGMQAKKDLAFEVFQDDNSVAATGAKVRIYHLSPGTGLATVDVDTNVVVQKIVYPQASAYLSVPAGVHTFDLTVASDNVGIPISTSLKSWTVTSLFVVGLLTGTPPLKFVTAQTIGMPGMPQTGGAPIMLHMGR
jgi:hypothetical protein